MNRVTCTLLVLVVLLGACRSTDDAQPQTPLTSSELRVAWLQNLHERDLHPATIAFVGSLWDEQPSIGGLARIDAIPSNGLIESVRVSDAAGFMCDGYTFTVHVEPVEGRYWITREGGIAGWVEHFGPGELPRALETAPTWKPELSATSRAG